ncbi:MAG: Uma2 family endonuclease [Cytophagaceae bacterium]|nr:Uma2 family endonuclease [Cytophagaceae bacterium]
MPITDISQLDPQGTYTYADYLKWQFDETVELIRGKIYRMSPAPKRRHQRISGQVFAVLHSFFSERNCELYDAPFDVRLPNPNYRPGENSKVYTVVQPDLCVFCDLSKLDDNGAVGAPDWVIEITSPGTIKKDFNEKFNLYEASGVSEYWIIVPESNLLHVYALREGVYQLAELFEGSGTVASQTFPEAKLDLAGIFA